MTIDELASKIRAAAEQYLDPDEITINVTGPNTLEYNFFSDHNSPVSSVVLTDNLIDLTDADDEIYPELSIDEFIAGIVETLS